VEKVGIVLLLALLNDYRVVGVAYECQRCCGEGILLLQVKQFSTVGFVEQWRVMAVVAAVSNE